MSENERLYNPLLKPWENPTIEDYLSKRDYAVQTLMELGHWCSDLVCMNDDELELAKNRDKREEASTNDYRNDDTTSGYQPNNE